jgi:hypothetical protein
MAGRPRRQAMIAELLSRTANECDDIDDATPLDYVERWISNGSTLKDLGNHIAKVTKPEDLEDSDPSWSISGDMIRRYLESLHGEAECEQRLSRARARSSYSMADDALAIADEAKPEDAVVARLRVQSRQWTAERFNPGAFGQSKGVNVSISVGGLHLQALQALPKTVTGSTQSSLHNTDALNAPNAEVLAIKSVSTRSE